MLTIIYFRNINYELFEDPDPSTNIETEDIVTEAITFEPLPGKGHHQKP